MLRRRRQPKEETAEETGRGEEAHEDDGERGSPAKRVYGGAKDRQKRGIRRRLMHKYSIVTLLLL